MKALWILVFMTALLDGTTAARAYDDTGTYMFYGVGGDSCGRYVAARRDKKDSIYVGWLGGYLTAYNNLSPLTVDILGGSDLEGAMLWIENYCSANPTDAVSKASHALTQAHLGKRHMNRKKDRYIDFVCADRDRAKECSFLRSLDK